MAFNVTFYSFSKKKNSTARPTGSGTTFACRIKAPSGIIHPIIEISSLSDTFPTFNYAYIPAFDERYYFVREWTQEPGNIWAVQLDADPLASWKTVIGAQSFYVLRSSAANDGDIVDSMYPVRTEASRDVETSANIWDLQYGGTFIVGVLAKTQSNQNTGGVNYIGFNETMFRNFLDEVYGTSANSSLYQAKEAIKKAWGISGSELSDAESWGLAYVAENPFTDYIDSITWVPGSVPFMTSQTGFWFGHIYLNLPYYNFDPKRRYNFYQTVTVPKHPKAATRGDYLNCSPFTEYKLFLPRAGAVTIDPGDLVDTQTLGIELSIDLITGEGLYTWGPVRPVLGYEKIAEQYQQIGVQVKITANKAIGTASTAHAQMLTAMGGALQDPIGSFGNTIAAINSYHRAYYQPGSTLGNAGGYLGLTESQTGTACFFALHGVFWDVVDDDNSHNGRPLCKVRTPASLGGYMIIQDADISIYGTEEEHDYIKETMESGFYYE